MEAEIRRLLKNDRVLDHKEALVALTAVWFQAACASRLDYLLEKSGDGHVLSFQKALDMVKCNVQDAGASMRLKIDKEDCYEIMQPIVRFFVSFVDDEGSQKNEDWFDALPDNGGWCLKPLGIAEVAPILVYLWKRRQALTELSWNHDVVGLPADQTSVQRAIEICHARVDALASDAFMDVVRNNTLARLMPVWTEYVPSARPHIPTKDFYLVCLLCDFGPIRVQQPTDHFDQCMRESNPDGLNDAYRHSSVPPLLVFKPGAESTIQQEVMLAMILCGTSIQFIDERRAERPVFPCKKPTVVFVANQYATCDTDECELIKGYGCGTTGLIGATLHFLDRFDTTAHSFITGGVDTFKTISDDTKFAKIKCF
jgi:hypothetical protein